MKRVMISYARSCRHRLVTIDYGHAYARVAGRSRCGRRRSMRTSAPRRAALRRRCSTRRRYGEASPQASAQAQCRRRVVVTPRFGDRRGMPGQEQVLRATPFRRFQEGARAMRIQSMRRRRRPGCDHGRACESRGHASHACRRAISGFCYNSRKQARDSHGLTPFHRPISLYFATRWVITSAISLLSSHFSLLPSPPRATPRDARRRLLRGRRERAAALICRHAAARARMKLHRCVAARAAVITTRACRGQWRCRWRDNIGLGFRRISRR